MDLAISGILGFSATFDPIHRAPQGASITAVA